MRLEKITEMASNPRQREQLAILVCDGSGSMNHPDAAGVIKGEAVCQCVKGLCQRLTASSRKGEIYFAQIVFDHRTELRVAPTSVTQVDQTMDFNPLSNHGGETAIGDALNMALQIAEEFLTNEQEGLPRDVVILLMSDGCHNAGSADPRDVAQQIKANEKIVTASAAYGKDADKKLLRELSSDPDKYYCEPKTGDELRDFFLASIESVERA